MKTREFKNTFGCVLIMFLAAFLFTITGCSGNGDEDDVITYTVTFDAGGGTPMPEVQKVEAGGTASAPATNPAKTGYVFLFWHLSGATTAYNFETPVTGNITLQAKWEEEAKVEYWQVSWELNGGAWPASGDNHATQVVRGGTLAEPVAPTKAGKKFDGWYKEASFTNKINFPYNVSAVTANITLYAKWVDPAVEYWQITWELNGGAWPSTGDNHVVKVEKGTTLTEPAAPTKSGSAFDGWYKEAGFTNKVTFPATVTGDFKLYAKWGTFTDDPNLKKAAYCLAYIYQVTEKKKQGQSISSISGICSVFYRPDATINYMSFSTHTAIVPFLKNTPLVIGATQSSSLDVVTAARSTILNGTYDYANDPAKIFAYFGTYTGPLFFSVTELAGKSTLDKLRASANNDGITLDALKYVSFPDNCYKILIYGKNKAGVLIGKYIGYAVYNGTGLTYWRLDPDDPNYGLRATIPIPN